MEGRSRLFLEEERKPRLSREEMNPRRINLCESPPPMNLRVISLSLAPYFLSSRNVQRDFNDKKQFS